MIGSVRDVSSQKRNLTKHNERVIYILLRRVETGPFIMSGGRWSFVSGKPCLLKCGEGEQQKILLDRVRTSRGFALLDIFSWCYPVVFLKCFIKIAVVAVSEHGSDLFDGEGCVLHKKDSSLHSFF